MAKGRVTVQEMCFAMQFNGSASGWRLALMGDDHNESSTNAHATEYQFVDTMMPILNPAGVQEVIDYGLYGYALSRFSGTWGHEMCKDNINPPHSGWIAQPYINHITRN